MSKIVEICEVCNRGKVIWPFPVNLKGKAVWACPDCYHKEHPGCMPVFAVKEVGPDAHLKLQGVSVAVPPEHEVAFKEGAPVFDTVMKLARDYYAGGITDQEARTVLISLGEGQEGWVKDALVNMCKGVGEESQLYRLGSRQPSPDKFSAITLQSYGGKTVYGLEFNGAEDVVRKGD